MTDLDHTTLEKILNMNEYRLLAKLVMNEVYQTGRGTKLKKVYQGIN